MGRVDEVVERVRLSETFGFDDLAKVRGMVESAAMAASFADRRDDLVLVVNELVTNAIRHGGGRGRLTIEYAIGSITVEVRDWGPGLAAIDAERLPDVTVAGGRGLWIARRLFPDFTMTSDSQGVIARLVLTAAARSDPPT